MQVPKVGLSSTPIVRNNLIYNKPEPLMTQFKLNNTILGSSQYRAAWLDNHSRRTIFIWTTSGKHPHLDVAGVATAAWQEVAPRHDFDSVEFVLCLRDSSNGQCWFQLARISSAESQANRHAVIEEDGTLSPFDFAALPNGDQVRAVLVNWLGESAVGKAE